MIGITNKVKVFAVFTTLMVLVNVVSISAQEEKGNLFIGNLMDEEITEFIIFPSKEHYLQNRSVAAFQDIQINKDSILGVVIPDYMTGFEFFDIEIVTGDNTSFTKKGVKIDFISEKTPTLYLSATDKNIANDLLEAAPGFVATTVPVFFTTARIAIAPTAKTAVAATAKTAGASFLSKISFLAIPKVGTLIACGALLISGVWNLYNNLVTPNELWVQVDYN